MDVVARPRPQAGRDRGAQCDIRLNHRSARSVVAKKYENLFGYRVHYWGVRNHMDGWIDIVGAATWTETGSARSRRAEYFADIAKTPAGIPCKNIPRYGVQ